MAQVEDVAYVCTTKRVDALRVIANDTQLAAFAGDLCHDHMLCEIGVLILVDENVAEKLPVVAQHIGIVAQQDVGIVEQVIEIHRTACDTAVTVGTVDSIHLRALGTVVGLNHVAADGIVFRRHKSVFRS